MQERAIAAITIAIVGRAITIWVAIQKRMFEKKINKKTTLSMTISKVFSSFNTFTSRLKKDKKNFGLKKIY